ncbi:hypothetical protein LTSEUGA_2739 [Salmonella enterica subsp. enterica serovar Uganda str. R8-3404]|uniref:Uncharacterized protein n=1 Tax=Salmonella enterica subsp. enterica serovar Uganda str. R8-3404 TaxID=913083 RepID=A0A6C8H3N0_SALET|nr:hypothetical protein LTSEUGA_2739 [Salmonella enterica subsp. enterica serovar Uganda str. R8-3404]
MNACARIAKDGVNACERLRRFPWMKMLICCGYFFVTPFCGVFLF